MEKLREGELVIDEMASLQPHQVQPNTKQIRQARVFYRVLCNKGYDIQAQACVLQALMNICRDNQFGLNPLSQPTDKERADTLNDAIQYALSLEVDDGLEWLRDWNEGEPDAMNELEEYLSHL